MNQKQQKDLEIGRNIHLSTNQNSSFNLNGRNGGSQNGTNMINNHNLCLNNIEKYTFGQVKSSS